VASVSATAEPSGGQGDLVDRQLHVLDNPAHAALIGPHE
jgi:hypothetical protein